MEREKRRNAPIRRSRKPVRARARVSVYVCWSEKDVKNEELNGRRESEKERNRRVKRKDVGYGGRGKGGR